MNTTTHIASTRPFLARLASAEATSVPGVSIFRSYICKSDRDDLYTALNEGEFWELKPRLFQQRLPQHAYLFNRESTKKKQKSIARHTSLGKLDNLCTDIEQQLDVKISNVYCNRFQDPNHHIDWHKDTYGEHILVLSLGSGRRVDFREDVTKQVVSLTPESGDMYFMPLHLNTTHMHRVNAAAEGVNGTRLSFVFFFEPPAYAKEYKITTKDRMRGLWNSMIE